MEDEEPATVKELLAEIKDTSELAVYLAYSALMFRDRQIAEEVMELEDRIDELLSKLRVAVVLAARNVEDAERVRPILLIASAADRISTAAAEIAELLLRGMEIHPLIFDALENAEEKVARCRVSEDSSLIGTSLGDADLESSIGMAVIAIRRKDGRWLWDPDDETVIEPGDVLIARGPKDGAVLLRELSTGQRSLTAIQEGAR